MDWIRKQKNIILVIGGIITGAALIFLLFDALSIQPKDFTFENENYESNYPILIIGIDENYPPYEYDENGSHLGYNVDIMQAAAHSAGYRVEFISKPWTETLQDIQDGKIDALAGLYISDARKNDFVFSSPHSYVSSGLFSKKNSNIESLEDLNGKTVVVQEGDLMDDFLQEQNLNTTIIHSKYSEDMIQMVFNNNADAALYSSISQGQFYLSKLESHNIVVHDLDLPPQSYAFAALKGNEALISKLDFGLTQIKASGEFDAINSKWFFNLGDDNHLAIIKNITYILFILLFALVIFIIWSQSLKQQVALKSQDLLKSQIKFQAIVENATEGILIIYDEKLTFANPKAISLLELNETDIKSTEVFSKIHPMDYSRIQGYYHDRLAGKPAPGQYTYRILTNTNKVIWLMNNVVLSTWDDKNVILIFFSDITKLRESEIALERSEERQKMALEASKDAIWDFNLIEGETYFSPQFYSMLGYEPDEFPATLKNWMEMIHHEDRKDCIKTLNQYLDKPDDISHELVYRMETKLGDYRWIRTKFKVTSYETGSIPHRMSGVHTDITVQKEFEETIRKERDVLNQIMQTSNNGFIVTDREGIVKYINPTAQRMLLSDGENGIGEYYTNFAYRVFDAEHRTELSSKKLIEYLKEDDKTFLTIERVLEINNSTIHVMINVAKLLSKENEFEGMVISIIDITERELGRQELIEREKRIRQIIHYSPFGIVMLDNELNILTASDHFIEDFSLNPEIPEKINLKEYAPNIYHRWKHIFEAALNGVRQGNLQDPFTQDNGEEEYIQWLCSPWYKKGEEIGGIMFYTEVITSEVLAYDALQQSEDKFAQTFHTSPDAITISRLEDGLYLDINFGFTEITGFSREDVIGRTVEDIHLWENMENRQEIFEKLNKAGEVNNFQTLMRIKNGETRHALISARTIEINNERCLITIGRDITNIVEANEKIQQMNLELEERIKERTIELERKNEELETFTYTVSHDLKAPLRGIDGYSRLLLEDYLDKLDEDGKYFLQNIRNSTMHMDNLINDLLNYSRLERRSIAIKSFNLEELIDRIINEYLHSRKETNLNIDLKVKEIETDYESLLQILRNLIDNAYKFARDGVEHSVTISSHMENGYCIIKVKDNGIGFDNKYKENIFKIFNRLHSQEKYPGTGIGLTIVKKGIERIGAIITAEGKLNEGAEFTIKIPQNESEKKGYA
jgi:PAS domain S-box-containing protein